MANSKTLHHLSQGSVILRAWNKAIKQPYMRQRISNAAATTAENYRTQFSHAFCCGWEACLAELRKGGKDGK